MNTERMPERGEDRIESALEEFRRAWFAGEKPDPGAFCRIRPECGRELLDRINDFLYVTDGLMGMTPTDYVCNCGPLSAPGGRLYDRLRVAPSPRA